jgi:hypothetical protein
MRQKLTVGELRKRIKGVPDDALVVTAVDPEGNAYRAIEEAVHGFSFEEQRTGVGEVGLTVPDTGIDPNADPDDFIEGGEPCVLLWPL